MEARIIKASNKFNKQELEIKLVNNGYKKDGDEWVLRKGFIWWLFFGFGSIFLSYLFLAWIIIYAIYIIYYLRTREKDRIKIIIER
jgi:hypothetical protein